MESGAFWGEGPFDQGALKWNFSFGAVSGRVERGGAAVGGLGQLSGRGA